MGSFALLLSALLILSALTAGHGKAIVKRESDGDGNQDLKDVLQSNALSGDSDEESGKATMERVETTGNEGVPDEDSDDSTKTESSKSTETGEISSEPKEQSSEPAEDSSEPPSEESSDPPEDSNESPSEESSDPPEDSNEPPSEESSDPPEDSNEPPSEESSDPPEDSNEPQSGESSDPPEESNEPLSEESSDPPEESNEPTEDSNEPPSDESSNPPEDSNEPTEEDSIEPPSEGSSDPPEDSNEPTEEDSIEPLSDESSDPPEDSNEPTEEDSIEPLSSESSNPSEDSNEPTEEDSNEPLSEESSDPSEDSIEPTEENSNEPTEGSKIPPVIQKDEAADGITDAEEEAGGQSQGEDDAIVLRRRKRSSRREYLLSQDHHPMEVTLVYLENDHHRVKRTSFNITTLTWPHHIPYIYDNSYNKGKVHQLEEVLKFMENHLCVKFQNEQTFDPRNSNWFKEHGYSTNAYIRFLTRPACVAVYGRGNSDKGGRSISPCNQLVSMMHEVIHSLGGIHSQNYPFREKYITVHKDNIEKKKINNYRKSNSDSSEVEFEYYDPSSLLNYATSYFTKNGKRTFDYICPEMAHLYGHASYANILFELTKNYKCQEKMCANEDPDCGLGYLGYIKQRCACVCPEGFDPATRCKRLLEKETNSASWPEVSFTLFKADDCPEGFQLGKVPITGRARPRMSLKRLKASGKTVNIEMCTKKSASQDFEAWPMGSYCIGKVDGVPCKEPFKEGAFTVTTVGTMQPTGSVGDVTVNGNKETLGFCCRTEGDKRFPMELPNGRPFRLMTNQIGCQEVKGMWGIQTMVMFGNKASTSGSSPRVVSGRRFSRFTSCYYQPPTYGCNKEVTLDPSNPSVTVSTPMKGNSRESNRRCFYFFQAPAKSRLRLTINKLSLHSQDKLLVRHFNLLENPYRINPKKPKYQVISEGNAMFIEYWSFVQTQRNLKGAELTVDLLSVDDLCYDAESQGADYAGDKSVSETFEDCLHWSEAAACPDFPWSGTHGLNLLNSGKSCRNLDSHSMLQPWCYTYVNGTMCNKRYCDVCNEADLVDQVSKCQSYISQDPKFCSEGLGRFACFKSCGMDRATYNKEQVKCSKPEIPSGLTTQDGLQDSYDVGASVTVTCGGQDSSIQCTTLGWTPFDDNCAGQQCIDASQLCQNTLAKFPEFCSNTQSKATAAKYCQKTCGLCHDSSSASCSVAGGANFSPESSSSSLTAGQDVTFACNDGQHYVSGDLRRACSYTGELLGEPPVCDASPAPIDINIKGVGEKDKTIPKISAYIMLGYGLDVPVDGKITRWYLHCQAAADVVLLVYRKTSNPKQFQLVGSNKVKCVAGWPWTHLVPPNAQIAVQKGDLLGVWGAKSAVSMQPCRSSPEVLVPVASTKSKKVGGLLNSPSKTFMGRGCAYVALGARVQPN